MKHALVTGVSTGIGAATAEMLLDAGYRVLGTVRKPEDAASLSARGGAEFVPIIADLAETEGRRSTVDAVAQALGESKLDLLVNNAGIARIAAWEHIQPENLRQHFEVNFFAVVELCQGLVPYMRAGSRIINVSSVNGEIATPFIGAYCASKHALEAFSSTLNMELRPRGIDVHVIAPGPVRTAIWEKLDHVDPTTREQFPEAMAFMEKMAKLATTRGMEAEAIARRILAVAEGRSRRYRHVMTIMPLTNHYLPKLVPRSTLQRELSKRFGLRSR